MVANSSVSEQKIQSYTCSILHWNNIFYFFPTLYITLWPFTDYSHPYPRPLLLPLPPSVVTRRLRCKPSLPPSAHVHFLLVQQRQVKVTHTTKQVPSCPWEMKEPRGDHERMDRLREAQGEAPREARNCLVKVAGFSDEGRKGDWNFLCVRCDGRRVWREKGDPLV